MLKKLRLLCKLSIVIFLAVFLLYVYKYLYVWNRLTLQTAEQSTLTSQRSFFLPVEGHGRYDGNHVTAGWYDIVNRSSSASSASVKVIPKAWHHVDDGLWRPVWNPPSEKATPLHGANFVDDNEQMKSRSYEYCNQRQSTWSETSTEGQLLSNYRLIGVVLLLRHGDRSPMYTLPNHASPRLSCSLQHQSSSLPARRQRQNQSAIATAHDDGDNVDDADSSMEPIRRFVASMQSLIIDQTSTSGRLFRRFGMYPNNSVCYGAQLTAAGAIQMYWLGRFLKSRYPDLAGSSFDDDSDPDGESNQTPPRVYVRSTEYPRTFQSATALLYGFLGRHALSAATFETTKNIYFCSESTAPGVYNQSCGCPAAARMLASLKKNKTYSVDERQVRDEVAEVFNVTSNRLPWMSAIMEVFMAYVCHGLPLPCGPKNRCISWHTIDRMWTLSDNTDGNVADVEHRKRSRPSPSSATLPAANSSADDDVRTLSAKLLAHPLLREIARRLLDLSSYRTRQTAANVVVFSGHDKTVSTAARALGVYDNRWPPYGSRMVFELHASSSADRPRYYIRLLYNGRDVTARLAFCPQSVLVSGLLCPLENFTFQMFDRIKVKGRVANSHAEACSM